MKTESFDNKDRILALIISLAMLVTTINISFFATDMILNQQNKGKTLLEQSENPAIEVFEISNAQTLNELALLTNSEAKYLDGTKSFAMSNYILTADIDLSLYNTGEGWLPIGTEQFPFKGNINGQGYLVKNLVIDSNVNKNQGLFGYIGDGATVSNMGIISAQVRGNLEVGILAGFSSGNIKNCYVKGSVSSLETQSSVGGIVGYNAGYIENCYSVATVSGQTVGGIAGYLVGEVKNSVALGDAITGSNKSGKIVGIGEKIINSYGRNDMLINGLPVNDETIIINGKDITALEATGLWWRDTALFSGAIWTFVDTQLPNLIRNTPPKEEEVEKILDGNGSEQEPYLINTIEDLSFIRNKINSNDLKYSETNIYFSLMNSLDLYTDLWTPIGTATVPFKGIFLGNENVIKNLKINGKQADYQGFFGYIGEGANISNLGILGANITANNYVGAIAGKADIGSIITNCYASADISANNKAGVLVGELAGEANKIVALSGTVNADVVAGRMIGDTAQGHIISNAYAWQGVLVNGSLLTQTEINDKNGFTIETKDNDNWIKVFGKTDSKWNVDYTTTQVKEMLIAELNINEESALIVTDREEYNFKLADGEEEIAPQEVIIENKGDVDVTIEKPKSDNFLIGDLSAEDGVIAPGEFITFSIQPTQTDILYTEEIEIIGNNEATTKIKAIMTTGALLQSPGIGSMGSISIDKTELDIKKGTKKVSLFLTTPLGTKSYDTIWKSSNEAVATIEIKSTEDKVDKTIIEVLINPVEGGTATITAKLGNDTVSCNVLVRVDVKSVYFIVDGESYTPTAAEVAAKKGPAQGINVGQELQLKAVFDPPNATNQEVTWKTDRQAIATVDINGKITCKGTTGTRVTVTSKENPAKNYFVRIFTGKQGVTGIALNPTDIVLDRYAREETRTYVKITPSNATNTRVTWASADTNIATVVASGGGIDGINAGKTIVTVTTDEKNEQNEHMTASFNVTVRATYKIETNKSRIDFTPDREAYESIEAQTIEISNTGTEDLTLTASVGANFILTPNIVNVPRGGKTTFTVKPIQGLRVGNYTDAIKIVTQKENEAETDILKRNNVVMPIAFEVIPRPVSGVSLADTEKIIVKGETFQMVETIAPSTATNKKVTWNSSDTAIATVDSNGLVSAIAPGNAVITVTTEDGNKKAICNVLVSAIYTISAVPNIKLDDEIESYTNQGTKTIEVTNTGNQKIKLKKPITENALLTIGEWSNTGEILPNGKVSFDIKMIDGLKIGHYEEVITIETEQNTNAEVKVTFNVIPNKVTGVTLPERISMTVNEKTTITATIEPSTATNKKVKWTSSDEEIVKIDENGKMTGLKVGKVTIQAETEDGAYIATCAVVVSLDVVIEGNVLYPNNNGVDAADIALIRGKVEIAKTQTDAQGAFNMTQVLLDGLYNLVISKDNTKVTTSFKVENSKVSPIRIIFPEGNQNTIVNIELPAMQDVIVEGLDKLYEDTNIFTQEDKDTANTGGIVEFRFNIKDITQGIGSDIEEVVKEESKGNTIEQYMDINIEKRVAKSGENVNDQTAKLIHKLQKKIDIVIDIPLSARGKAEYLVVAVHTGKAETIYDNDDNPNTITISADAFSTYALISSETLSRPGQGGDDDEIVIIETPAPPKSGNLIPYYTKDGKDIIIGISAFLNGQIKYVAPPGVEIKYKNYTEDRRTFIDTEGHWAESYIDFVSEREILMGAQGSAFEPESKMTRAMFVTVLGRLYEKSYKAIPESNEKSDFIDVEQGKYYSKYIKWATENEIINGISTTRFGAMLEITREEMTTIILRFAKLIEKAPRNIWNRRIPFNDRDQISLWAKESVMYCTLNDIVHGIDSNNFGPRITATRAEVAAMVERFVKVILD